LRVTAIKHVIAATLLSLLAGCAGFGGISSGGGIAAEKDSAPLNFDPSKIIPASPSTEAILPRGNKSPYVVFGKEYTVLDWHKGFKQRGVASWYGAKFDGRQTSNGEIFDVYAMTAAHRELPLPLYIRVTNLTNGKNAIVRVNDRGPFVDERVLDVSYAVAYTLGFSEMGTAPVEIEVLETGNERYQNVLKPQSYYVQLGAYVNEEQANTLQEEVSGTLPFPVVVVSSDSIPAIYRVRIGPYATRAKAQEILKAVTYLREGQDVALVTAPQE
jgi:rare lipoprotein A